MHAFVTRCRFLRALRSSAVRVSCNPIGALNCKEELAFGTARGRGPLEAASWDIIVTSIFALSYGKILPIFATSSVVATCAACFQATSSDLVFIFPYFSEVHEAGFLLDTTRKSRFFPGTNCCCERLVSRGISCHKAKKTSNNPPHFWIRPPLHKRQTTNPKHN